MIQNELIGSFLEVIDSLNVFNKKIKGKILFETRNTFEIETNNGKKIIIKKINKFKITKNGKTLVIDGKDIEKVPEERIKLKCRKQKTRKFLE